MAQTYSQLSRVNRTEFEISDGDFDKVGTKSFEDWVDADILPGAKKFFGATETGQLYCFVLAKVNVRIRF